MIDTAIGMVTVPELEALVSLNLDAASRYQAIADSPEADPETRQSAAVLAAWRHSRAQFFSMECAETERLEAAEVAPDYLNVHELAPVGEGPAAGEMQPLERVGPSVREAAPRLGVLHPV